MLGRYRWNLRNHASTSGHLASKVSSQPPLFCRSGEQNRCGVDGNQSTGWWKNVHSYFNSLRVGRKIYSRWRQLFRPKLGKHRAYSKENAGEQFDSGFGIVCAFVRIGRGFDFRPRLEPRFATVPRAVSCLVGNVKRTTASVGAIDREPFRKSCCPCDCRGSTNREMKSPDRRIGLQRQGGRKR